jgi:hypothetical protein
MEMKALAKLAYYHFSRSISTPINQRLNHSSNQTLPSKPLPDSAKGQLESTQFLRIKSTTLGIHRSSATHGQLIFGSNWQGFLSKQIPKAHRKAHSHSWFLCVCSKCMRNVRANLEKDQEPVFPTKANIHSRDQLISLLQPMSTHCLKGSSFFRSVLYTDKKAPWPNNAPQMIFLSFNWLGNSSGGVPMGILSTRLGWVVLLWGPVAL